MSETTGPTSPANRTYGEHQEAAAAACTRLLINDTPPIDQGDVDQLLRCRGVVLDALSDRLAHLGDQTDSHAAASTINRWSLSQVATDPVPRLASVLDNVARHDPSPPSGGAIGVAIAGERPSPLELLTTPSGDATTENWRDLASSLTAGNHALSAAARQPWLTDPGAAWPLVGDLAATVETVLVLDERLSEVGILPTPQEPIGIDQRRLVAAQCLRMASWHQTSTEADLAVPALPATDPVLGSIQLVNQPADLAPAQRQLASDLRHSPGLVDGFGAPMLSMDLVTARTVTATEIAVCDALSDRCLRSPTTTALAAEFSSRSDLLHDVAAHLPRLVEVERVRPHQRALWQVQEIGRGLRSFTRASRSSSQAGPLGLDQLNPSQLLDLATATHDVMTTTAAATRHELHRDASNLRLADPLGYVGNTRSHRRTPVALALKAACDAPPPVRPPISWAPSTARTALRNTLDTTPSTSPRRPSPYPARTPRRGDNPRPGR